MDTHRYAYTEIGQNNTHTDRKGIDLHARISVHSASLLPYASKHREHIASRCPMGNGVRIGAHPGMGKVYVRSKSDACIQTTGACMRRVRTQARLRLLHPRACPQIRANTAQNRHACAQRLVLVEYASPNSYQSRVQGGGHATSPGSLQGRSHLRPTPWTRVLL